MNYKSRITNHELSIRNLSVFWFFVFTMSTLSFGQESCELNKLKVNELKNGINEFNLLSSISKIDSLFSIDVNCFSEFEKSTGYNDLSELVYKLNPSSELIYSLSGKAIKHGFISAVLLEYSQNQWLKKVSPSDYNRLELLSDSLFFVKYPNANVNLAKTIRSMVRKDQQIRLEHRNTNPSDSIRCDSLLYEMKKIDDLNEYLLDSLFTIYGYPGYSLVGCEHNSCYLIFQHMGTEFQVKKIHLLEEAIEKKELYQDIHPLIDKVLYKKYGVTLYGTHYSNQPPEKELKVINYYLALLSLKLQ